jgi:hypothetical protein
MTRPRGWIIGSILVAAVDFWWGPLRFIIYAGPNDVPTSQSLALSIWLGWFWIATGLQCGFSLVTLATCLGVAVN